MDTEPLTVSVFEIRLEHIDEVGFCPECRSLCGLITATNMETGRRSTFVDYHGCDITSAPAKLTFGPDSGSSWISFTIGFR
jgi:hypothetical protein